MLFSSMGTVKLAQLGLLLQSVIWLKSRILAFSLCRLTNDVPQDGLDKAVWHLLGRAEIMDSVRAIDASEVMSRY